VLIWWWVKFEGEGFTGIGGHARWSEAWRKSGNALHTRALVHIKMAEKWGNKCSGELTGHYLKCKARWGNILRALQKRNAHHSCPGKHLLCNATSN